MMIVLQLPHYGAREPEDDVMDAICYGAEDETGYQDCLAWLWNQARLTCRVLLTTVEDLFAKQVLPHMLIVIKIRKYHLCTVFR